MSGVVGRLAPSPTGALHLGNVRTFMIAWLSARSQGGKVIMRMEDLDHPRDKPGAAVSAIEDLCWLGFDWDEEYVQSCRRECYRAALSALRSRDLVYPCVCSRRDVESVQSAPHSGEQLHYPGICRDRFPDWRSAREFKGSDPCWRFRVPTGTLVEFNDRFAGIIRQDVSAAIGDFPLARDEYGAGYTLASTVDDLLMGVTEVVRGDDLLAATPSQVLIAQALQESGMADFAAVHIPDYCHVPLVVGDDGRRLAKRHGDTRVAAFRNSGLRPRKILGLLAESCGWAAGGEEVSLQALLPRFTLSTIPRSPFVWTSRNAIL